jgi:hypothetical protein
MGSQTLSELHIGIMLRPYNQEQIMYDCARVSGEARELGVRPWLNE